MIPAGYTLALVHQGTIVDTIDLEGADLGKAGGASSVAAELDDIVRRHIATNPQETR